MIATHDEPQRFDGVLRHWARVQPDKAAITYLHEGAEPSASLTYSELDQHARRLARRLREHGAQSQRAILLYRGDNDFVVAFFACLYAGVIAVPVARPQRKPQHWQRLEKICRDCGATFVLSTRDDLAGAEEWRSCAPVLCAAQWLPTDEMPDAAPGAEFEESGESTAFLQYTSGSTGDPKGVIVTHANLLHNEKQLYSAFQHSNESRIVSWLPLFHDMGLIGNLLQAIYAGASYFYMSPMAFLQRPLRWLQAVSRFRADTSGAPNFAYDLCAQIDTAALAGLDLSCWRVAFNGAETVRAETMRRFADRFAVCGFNPDAFYPCYGLAEATLFVTGGRRGAAVRSLHLDRESLQQGRARRCDSGAGSIEIVSLGTTYGEQQLSIVDPTTRVPLQPGAVGEIWIKGESVAGGYWSKAEASQHTFRAELATGGVSDGFMRTGDLGFVLDGQVYCTGRLKDLIVVRGRNYYPQDLEHAVQSVVDHVRAGCGAAFQASDDHDGAVVFVQEISREALKIIEPAPVIERIRQAIADAYELSLADIVLLKPGSLPKTSSGKLQRKLYRKMYANGELDALSLAGSRPVSSSLQPRASNGQADALAMFVTEHVAQLAGMPSSAVTLERPCSDFGLDSLRIMQLIQRVRDRFGLELEVESMFSRMSLREVCARAEPVASPAPLVAQSLEVRSPLCVNQQALWFLKSLAPNNPAYNLPFAIRLGTQYSGTVVKRALQAVIDAQAVARVVITIDEHGMPLQELAANSNCKVELVDARGWDGAAIRSFVASAASAVFGVEREPLIRAYVLDHIDGPVVVVVTHHMVSDLWSQALLISEFADVLQGRTARRQEGWPYFAHVQAQKEYLTSARYRDDLKYWEQQLSGHIPHVDLRVADPVSIEVEDHQCSTHDFVLPRDLVASMERLAREHDCSVSAVLLGAYSLLLHRLTGQEDIVVGMPVAGRNHPAFDACQGYFVNVIALRSKMSAGLSASEFLRRSFATLLSGLRHGEVPIQLIIERLKLSRDGEAAALFNVMFSHSTNPLLPGAGELILGQPATGLRVRGLELEALHVDVPGAQVDLSLTLADARDGGIVARMTFRQAQLSREIVVAWCDCYVTLLAEMARQPDAAVAVLPLLSNSARRALIQRWSGERVALDETWTLPRAIASKALRTPQRVAISSGETRISYQELERRTDELAQAILSLRLPACERVGVHLHQSIDTVLWLIAVMKAGGAYVPLDPEYPRNRLTHIAQQADLHLVISTRQLQGVWAGSSIPVLLADGEHNVRVPAAATQPRREPRGSDVAYIMFTSGSTGTPKGVPISHMNIANLFAGLDAKVPVAEHARLLSITSISFDISVLEMFWTLARGMELVLPEAAPVAASCDFSLMFFASEEADQAQDCYRLLLDAAQQADRLGFEAIWIPERHFHRFGGQFPNPSVVAAALAASTRRLGIRAGSVVLPLHHPARVAEEWSIVDALSGGRVGVSFASGWHADDFLINPGAYADRRTQLADKIAEVQALWRGESRRYVNGVGKEVEITTHPRPVQKELPTWVTTAGNVETFIHAGKLGANLLTHLLGQNVTELETKLRAYREARREAGFTGEGRVTVMLHTYVCEDDAVARERVEAPFKRYLASSLELMRPLAQSMGLDPVNNSDLLVQHAFERYYSTSALFGTADSCRALVDRLRAIGVGEIACLIDFGIDAQQVLDALPHLAKLMGQTIRQERLANTLRSISTHHGISHFQCTPSYARLLLSESHAERFLAGLDVLMLGGEPVPMDVVERCRQLGCRNVLNMYGPTETTVWSAVAPAAASGRGGYAALAGPIANTQLLVVDQHRNLAAPGSVGELAILGAGLSTGYWRDEARTRLSFVPNPFPDAAFPSMYLTGDLVRQAHDGGLTFIARNDQQVKLNGRRIDLGEIEHHVQRCTGVSAAAVEIIRHAGASSLCCFVVGPATLDFQELRRQLALELPDYMVPAQLHRIEQLPRTPNGKLDRKALASLVRDKPVAVPIPIAAAGSDLERRILDVWRVLLGCEQIGTEQNFFELGGHSLLLPKLQFMLRAQLGAEVEVVHLLQHPTVRSLARHIGADERLRGGDLKELTQRRAEQRRAAARRNRARSTEARDV